MSKEKMSGYASIDLPWLNYLSEEARNVKLSNKTLYEVFKESEKLYFDGRVMLDYYGAKFNYKYVRERVEKVACALKNIGVKKGDYVSLCIFIAPEVIYLVYAINKLGAIVNFINPFELDEVVPVNVTKVNSQFLFTFDMFAHKFKDIEKDKMPKHIISMSALDSMIPISKLISRFYGLVRYKVPEELNAITWKEFMNKGSSHIDIDYEVKGDDPAIVFPTSGTSGHSKGALVSSKAINNCLEQYSAQNSRIGNYDSCLCAVPMYHAFAITTGLHEAIRHGMKLVMRMPGNNLLVDAFKNDRVNHVAFMPQIWQTFVDQDKKIDMSCVIDPITGSDILTTELEDKINDYLKRNGSDEVILNGFGLTEVCAAACVNTKEHHKSGSVGLPFAKTIISAFDPDTGKEKKYNEIGELCITSPSVMIEYVGLPEKTKEVLQVHDDGRLWFHSGDLGFVDEEGFVYYKSRKSRSFYYQFPGVTRGVNFKIDYSDIEDAFKNHELVERCVAIPRPDKECFNLPVLLVQLKGDYKKLDAEKEKEIIDEFRKEADKKLLKHLRPVDYKIIEEIPLTLFGKIDYQKVDAMYI